MVDDGGGEQIENDGGGVVMHEVHAQIEVAAELTQVFECHENPIISLVQFQSLEIL